MWTYIIAAIVLCVVGVAAFLTFRNRKKRKGCGGGACGAHCAMRDPQSSGKD